MHCFLDIILLIIIQTFIAFIRITFYQFPDKTPMNDFIY